LRLLIDSVKEYAIFMLDAEGRIASWNLGAARMIGYTPAEIIGRSLECFYPSEAAARGALQQDLAVTIKNGSLETNGWRVRKDGSRFWANVVIYAMHDLEGRLRGFSQVIRDLTERQQFEELTESRQRTQEFLAMLSHELRNPLAPLKTSVELLRMRNLDDPLAAHTVDVIDRQVKQLTRIVGELLDVSRITSGRITLARETLDLETVIAGAVETARPLLETKGHSLVLKPAPYAISIQGDITRLTQVIVNLLNNAARYTPEGGRIEIEVRPEQDSVAIHIRDNGVGMSAELLPRVFELFTQGQRPLDRTDGGLGVGLALVHRIVSLHGGTVTALSAGPGRGSEFIVTLPCERLAPQAVGTQAPPAQKENSMTEAANPPGGERQPKRRRVMVIDDNKDAAESMSMLFELWGHEVICAYDGRAALEAAAKYRPDAVFLDIGLPGMDGYEIAERLRELPESAHTVLVAITGYGQDEDRRRSREAGIDHHLVKPVAPETLQKLLESLERH
jgi:PAS domain S-box-containing protein